jgi:phage gpG-like protein
MRSGVETSGFEGADKGLALIQDSFSNADLEKFFSKLGPVLIQQTQDRIDVEKKAPDGSPWKPWEPKYARRQARFPGREMLKSTGRMRASLVSQAARTSVIMRPDVSYAVYVNRVRRFIGFSKENRRQIAVLFRDQLRDILSTAMKEGK